MRYLIIGVLILCLLIGLCWFSELKIRECTTEISAPLQLALNAIRNEDEGAARDYIAMAAYNWNEYEGVLASFISHDHTNKIGEAIALLPWVQDIDLAQAVEALLKQVQDLAEMDRIIWRNIF